MKRAPRSGEVGREMSPGASGDADRSPAGQQAPGHRATEQTGATKDQAARHGARAGSGMRRAAGNGPLAHLRPQESDDAGVGVGVIARDDLIASQRGGLWSPGAWVFQASR
jgi:hypothetical protein